MYGESALNRVMVWKWCKIFDEWRIEIHDDERSERPLVISEELVDAVIEKIMEDSRVKIYDLCIDFPHISHIRTV